MDAARAAIGKITSRKGHTTDVDEYVNPAVVNEVIKPHRHEEITEAVDREVHQDHYHTTVQPIQHKERLPEKHVHNLAPQIEREFRHDNQEETQHRVSQELGQFQNSQIVTETSHTRQAAPAVAGEHVHHHVHETVQPVIHKETIQPEVVHTTVPIHETHIAGAQHHGMSALPMKTLDEFTRAGGIVTGSKSHTHEQYEGAPRPYNEKLATTIEKVLPGHHGASGTHTTSSHHTGVGAAGVAGVGTAGALGTHSHRRRGSNSSSSSSDNDGVRRSHRNKGTTGQLGTTGTTGSTGTTGTTGTTHKPSLMDKLNPRVDANGDGKPGFMK